MNTIKISSFVLLLFFVLCFNCFAFLVPPTSNVDGQDIAPNSVTATTSVSADTITPNNGGNIRVNSTTTAHEFAIQAYNTDAGNGGVGAGWIDMIQFANGDGPVGTFAGTWIFPSPWAIPNAVAATIDGKLTASGHIGYDTTNGSFNMYSSKFSDGIIQSPDEKTWPTFVILEPDVVAGVDQEIQIAYFPAETFPYGVTIRSIHVTASAACTDTINFEEWTNNGSAWSTTETVEEMVLSGTYTEDDGLLSSAAMAADSYLFVDLEATMDDIAQLAITFTYTINGYVAP